MLSKIKELFCKKILKIEKKPISNGYAERCVKCGIRFKEAENFIGASYENFVDLDLFGSTADVFVVSEYICSFEEPKVNVNNAICYDCFNNFVSNKTIVYDGYERIYTKKDFFKID